MGSWRDQILQEFTPRVARLTLAADPDGLLLEEGVLAEIRARGFELIPFEDHVACRYAYESRFRSRWDRGEDTDLVVVLRAGSSDLSSLPYDFLQIGRRLSFSLGEIFPHLSYPVLAALARHTFDALYEAQQRHAPGPLGENASKDFVLRHVYGIAAEAIATPVDLLRVLLPYHYRGEALPPMLADRLLQLLRQNPALAAWPLEAIVPDREAFCLFLQEQWPRFLDRLTNAAVLKVQERPPADPDELPFDHPDIRAYLDTFFLEGLLQPVDHPRAASQAPAWVRCGVRVDAAADRRRRLAKLLEKLCPAIPGAAAPYTHWLQFARQWAELLYLHHSLLQLQDHHQESRLAGLKTQVDEAFFTWLSQRYAGLSSLPPLPPVMVHHLPRFLARQLEEQRHPKVALLVVDGLAWDQWLVVREELQQRQPSLVLREQAVFAWIPTLTSVSRQALFAGRPPFYFPQSIGTTAKEPDLWRQFWLDQGLDQDQVLYLRGLGDGNLESLTEQLGQPRLKVAGLVLDKVDQIMHGMALGAAGMHNQVRQWVQQGYLANLLELLLAQGFGLFLTADHGNIEAQGCGRPSEGALADLRGERVRVFSDDVLRRRVHNQFPEAWPWPALGLPEDYLALLAPGRTAFVSPGEKIVSHGGLTVEEVVVPLVQIDRRQR